MASEAERERHFKQLLAKDSLQPHYFKIIVDSKSEIISEIDRREFNRYYKKETEVSNLKSVFQLTTLAAFTYAVSRFVVHPSTKRFNFGLLTLTTAFTLANFQKQRLHHNPHLREIYSKYNITANPQALEILKARIH